MGSTSNKSALMSLVTKSAPRRRFVFDATSGHQLPNGDAFRRLAEDGTLEPDLEQRLVRASGFRNAIVHAYQKLDLRRVHEAASKGPDDLRALLARVASRVAT